MPRNSETLLHRRYPDDGPAARSIHVNSKMSIRRTVPQHFNRQHRLLLKLVPLLGKQPDADLDRHSRPDFHRFEDNSNYPFGSMMLSNKQNLPFTETRILNAVYLVALSLASSSYRKLRESHGRDRESSQKQLHCATISLSSRSLSSFSLDTRMTDPKNNTHETLDSHDLVGIGKCSSDSLHTLHATSLLKANESWNNSFQVSSEETVVA
jgi:hypothetical protein